MSSTDLTLGVAVGAYVGCLTALGTAVVLDLGGIAPAAQAAGVVALLLAGGFAALRPRAVSLPVVRYRLHHVVLAAHVVALLGLFLVASSDGPAAQSPFAFPLVVSAGVGLVPYVLVRDRHSQFRFGDLTPRVRWEGRPSDRTTRRKRILAVVVAASTVVVAVAVGGYLPHYLPWLESTTGWSVLADVSPYLIGSVLGGSIGAFISPAQYRRCSVYDGGIVLQTDRSGLRSLCPWWYVRGYELTDHELVIHAWFPLQSYRFDREHFQYPDRVAGILDEYVDPVESTWF